MRGSGAGGFPARAASAGHPGSRFPVLLPSATLTLAKHSGDASPGAQGPAARTTVGQVTEFSARVDKRGSLLLGGPHATVSVTACPHRLPQPGPKAAV